MDTRAALIEATIQVIHRVGYNGATTAAIADEARISRGSIIYHFTTRAQLMADVIACVYEREHLQYEQLQQQGHDGSAIAEWPEMLWEVLSQPSGMAVIEILQASRSDPELAELVRPTQERIELISAKAMTDRFGWIDETERLAAMRLFVWAIRGLSIAQMLVRDPREIEESVRFFRKMALQAFGPGSGAQGLAAPVPTKN